MTNVDQFESVFRSAAKEVFAFEPVSIDSVLVITDRADDAAYAIGEEIKQFLNVLKTDGGEPEWDIVPGAEFDSIDRLRTMVEERSPQLICTYRHVNSGRHRSRYTLGDFAAMLTQATTVPVLLIPHPDDVRPSAHALRDTRTVMAMTSHLTGDNRLVNWALRFTKKNGSLFLTHIEDECEFERYIDAISKIPELNTDIAREMIHKQLLKEPADFIQSCNLAAQEREIPVHIETIVAMGHHLNEYKRLVAEHDVRLLVMNTKDEDQFAMHGLAYPLAVELRETPLLLL